MSGTSGQGASPWPSHSVMKVPGWVADQIYVGHVLTPTHGFVLLQTPVLLTFYILSCIGYLSTFADWLCNMSIVCVVILGAATDLYIYIF